MLGSATPSLESWQRCGDGRYLSLALPARGRRRDAAWCALPTCASCPGNARRETVLAPAAAGGTAAAHGLWASRACCCSTAAATRRCFTAADCGWKSGCPHCSAWRVFHKADRTLRCHHCGFDRAVPRACPDCGNLDIAPDGPRHREAGGAAGRAAARRPRGPHRRRQRRATRVRWRRSWRPCTPARSTCWWARRWWPRGTTSAASRWWPPSTPTARSSAATSAPPSGCLRC
jgi:primosomal protein N' (replication factor Y)